MKLIKIISLRRIMPAIALAFLISGTNLHADYQTDQDIQKAAQKLKDTEDAQRAADERAANQREYEQDAPSGNSHSTLITTVIIIGGAAAWLARIMDESKKKR